jgi:hypothetical protein
MSSSYISNKCMICKKEINDKFISMWSLYIWKNMF